MYDGLRVFLVSHTHWDREWYMSLQPSISRYVKLMDRLLELLERNPDYRTFHMDGQVLPHQGLSGAPARKGSTDPEICDGGQTSYWAMVCAADGNLCQWRSDPQPDARNAGGGTVYGAPMSAGLLTTGPRFANADDLQRI